MGKSPDFLHKFYNIEGSTISERKKNFNKVLKTHSFSNEDEIKVVLKNITPRNYLEQIFYVEAFIYFKRKDDLLELLKGGNELYAVKILKQKWLLKVLFNEIESNILVNEFFPALSYKLKKKFINRIIRFWPSKKFNDLFEALNERYGLKEAVAVLHKCTPMLIKKIFNNHEIKLNTKQVVYLLKVDEELFNIYMNYMSRELTMWKCRDYKVLKYLAIYKPKCYLELEKSYGEMVASRKGTAKIISMCKTDIIENSEYYFERLNKSVLIQKIPHFRWYVAYHPSPIYNTPWSSFIYSYSGENSLSLNEFFKLNYSDKQMKDVIQKWAELHYKNEGAKYLVYYKPEIFFTLFKEKFNVTEDINEKHHLIELMMSCCEKYKDFQTLGRVLQYIVENIQTLRAKQILNGLCVIYKNVLDDFSEEVWKYINEIIKIVRIQKELHFFLFQNCIEKYVQFLFKNELNYKDALNDYMTDLLSQSRGVNLLNLNNKLIEKKIYYEMGKIVENGDTNWSHKQLLNLLSLILDFSINNFEYCINLNDFSKLTTFINELLHKLNLFEKTIVTKILEYKVKCINYLNIDEKIILTVVKKITEGSQSFSIFTDLYKLVLVRNRNNLQQSLLVYYLDNHLETYPDIYIINWCLKNEPKLLVPYFDKITEQTLTSHNLDYKAIRYCSFLNFDKKLCNYYKLKLESVHYVHRKRLLTALSILLTTDDFKKLIEDRYLNFEDKELHYSQIELFKLIYNVTEVYKMLPVIMKFYEVCDYLKLKHTSSNKLFNKVPERLLYTYIELLSEMSPSAKIHALYVCCEFLDKEFTSRVLKRKDHNNILNNMNLFRPALKYFVWNPSNDIFDAIIKRMLVANINNEEKIYTLTKVRFPIKYEDYLIFCQLFVGDKRVKKIKRNLYFKNYIKFAIHKLKGDISLLITKDFIICFIKKSCLDNDLSNNYLVEIIKTRYVFEDLYFDFKQYNQFENKDLINKIASVSQFFPHNHEGF